MQRVKIEGERFGMWQVGSYIANRHNHSVYLCKCDCGATKEVSGSYLRNGKSKSCGCEMYGKSRFEGKSLKRHLPHYYRLRDVHHGMQLRCSIKGKGINKNYYHRGIRVCSEWRSYPSFYSWAIKNGYQPGLQIDRINNDGNYEPSNCRWVTPKENAKNRRKRSCWRIRNPKGQYTSK